MTKIWTSFIDWFSKRLIDFDSAKVIGHVKLLRITSDQSDKYLHGIREWIITDIDWNKCFEEIIYVCDW